MTGTLLNTGGILAGGIFGLASRKDLSARNQLRLKSLLGALVVYVGFSSIWVSVNGRAMGVFKQLAIVMLALLAGNITGKTLRLQKAASGVGRSAMSKFQQTSGSTKPAKLSDGLATCAVFFCIGPMSVLGAVQDGLTGDFRTLAIKAALDGFSAVAFARALGWGVLISAVPVLAWQGTLTLGVAAIRPWLDTNQLADSVHATCGLLTILLCLVIFDVRKVPMADYLPSLIFAPLLSAWWR